MTEVSSETAKTQTGARKRPPAPNASGKSGERWSYFGWAERPYFQKMSRFRYNIFRPFLEWLLRMGIRPNHVTAASFVVVLIGFPLFYGARQYALAFAALALHIILDGFDGPLALAAGRHGTAQGALMDMSNDVTGLVIVLMTVSYFGDDSGSNINLFIGSIYAITYLYLTIMAVAQNLLGLSYSYVVKTKFPVYFLLMGKWLFGVDLVTPLMALASVYMGLTAFFGFLRVARALR